MNDTDEQRDNYRQADWYFGFMDARFAEPTLFKIHESLWKRYYMCGYGWFTDLQPSDEAQFEEH